MKKVYLVGGAVRDKLLGLIVKDRDWLVVGSSVKEMLELGYKQVGKDFPVFLHPQTNEEYALARTERKTKKGYLGFEVDTKNVTLAQDLSRRDLTINALVEDENGQLIDLFGGVDDLNNGLLRHISENFIEDPVRVLRVARFGARFKEFGFKVAHPTFKLMKQMVASGEVDALQGERVWLEINKILNYKNPSVFFYILHSTGALARILPIFKNYEQVKNNKNNFEFLDNVKNDAVIRWAALFANFSLEDVIETYKKISIPNAFKDLSLLTIKLQNIAKNFKNKSVLEIFNFYKSIDIYRRQERFEQLLTIFENLNIATKDIKKCSEELLKIDIKSLDKNNIATELPKKRQQVITDYLK